MNMEIDEKIEKLKKEIEILEQQKTKLSNNYCLESDCQEGNMRIVYYDYVKKDDEKSFSTFKKLFDYLNKKITNNNLLVIDFFQNKEWNYNQFNELNDDNIKKIMNIIFSLDAYSIYSMDFGIINKKEQWKSQMWIETPFLLKYQHEMEKVDKTERDYDFLNKGNEWRLF